jgi:hypothetical protein
MTERHTLYFIAVVVLIGLLAAIYPAYADGVNLTAYPVYNEIRTIQNGDCVEINSTVNIASLGWGVPHLRYYGMWMDNFFPGNDTPIKKQIDMPNTVKKLSNYYIDPILFGDSTGYWYQGYDYNTNEVSGNTRMFKVEQTCGPKEVTNYTVVVNLTNTITPKKLPYLPAKRDSDILIARGDDLALTTLTPLQWWLFGYARSDGIYDRSGEGNKTIITNDDFKYLNTGNYQLVLVRPGDNKITEEYYNPEYKPEKFSNDTYPAIVSVFRATNPISLFGLDPQSIESVLKTYVDNSIDDNLTTYRMQFMEPEIQIKRIDAIQNKTNSTWYNIRGYTNVRNGTELTFTIDADKLNGKTIAIRQSKYIVESTDDPGEWRQFNAMIPVDYTQVFPGPHDITVTSPQGATQTVPFYIYKELPAHYIPSQYIDYVGVSPYVTPQIITNTVTVPGPVVTVPGPIVTITPSEQDWNNYVEAQHRVLIEEGIIGAVIVFIICFVIYMIYTIYRSRRKM